MAAHGQNFAKTQGHSPESVTLEEQPPIVIPQPTGNYAVDESVIAAFPERGTTVIHAQNYGESLWGKTAKINARLPSGASVDYFLKVITLGSTGRRMCEGEFESLKAIHAVTPHFVPRPYAWGKFSAENSETYFFLAEFRNVGEQTGFGRVKSVAQLVPSFKQPPLTLGEKPAEPTKLATGLADLHRKSKSPTGKFGFHMSTCHAKIAQAVDSWEESWCALYTKHLGHTMELARPIVNRRDFDILSKLTLEKVVPRLLLPLQANGRVLKPCLIHGDCWDGNTAMDAKTGEAFVFDVCSFYGHNEYDTGNWRAPRHRLSNKAYITAYKRRYPVSEPEGEWDWRNLLYSLTFNIGNTIYIPGSSQKEVVIADMQSLCNEFCPNDIPAELKGQEGHLISTPDIYQEFVDNEEEAEDGGSEVESVVGSRTLTKPRYLGADWKEMADALDDQHSSETEPPKKDLGTNNFESRQTIR